MAQINFVAEFGSVIRYCYENNLPVRERMLLIALFYIANSRAIPMQDENANIFYEWPDDFFSISNAELNLYAGLEKRAIIEARNSLCQRGIIEVNAGQRRAKVPQYKLRSLSIGYNYVPKDTPKAPQNSPKDTPKAPQKHPLIYKQKQTKDTYMGDEEDDFVEEGVTAPARADGCRLSDETMNHLIECKNRVEKSYLAFVGRKPMPAEIEAIRPVTRGMNLDLIGEAIRVAASSGGKNIALYAKKLLVDWKGRGIDSISTLEDVMNIDDMVRQGFYTEADGRERIKEITGK